MLRLMYVLPDGNIIDTEIFQDDLNPGFWDWINRMVRNSPDVNFFFTTLTTDVFPIEQEE